MSLEPLLWKLYKEDLFREIGIKRKNVVKPRRKVNFTQDDLRNVERYMSQKLQIRQNRITDRQGNFITDSFADDVKLVQVSREHSQRRNFND